MTEVVLDASALLALLNDEPGAEMVKDRLSEALISAVNWAETASILHQIGMSSAEVRDVLAGLPVRTVAFDEAQAYATAALRPATRSAGLSLGDRACLALAMARKLPVLTADRAWSKVKLGVRMEFLR